MGAMLECHCENCDYSTLGILLGYGMIPGYFYFPAYNSKNKAVVSLDIFRYLEMKEFKAMDGGNSELERFKLARKAPYFLSSMYKIDPGNVELLSESPYLQSKYNFCPQCKTFQLIFEEYGLFD
jgi:hypothetical protein